MTFVLRRSTFVDDHRYKGDDESERRCLQGKGEPDHDLACIGGCVEVHVVKGQHDAQNGAEQADVGCVRRHGGDNDKPSRQFEFKRFDAFEALGFYRTVEKGPLQGDGTTTMLSAIKSPMIPNLSWVIAIPSAFIRSPPRGSKSKGQIRIAEDTSFIQKLYWKQRMARWSQLACFD